MQVYQRKKMKNCIENEHLSLRLKFNFGNSCIFDVNEFVELFTLNKLGIKSKNVTSRKRIHAYVHNYVCAYSAFCL